MSLGLRINVAAAKTEAILCLVGPMLRAAKELLVAMEAQDEDGSHAERAVAASAVSGALSRAVLF